MVESQYEQWVSWHINVLYFHPRLSSSELALKNKSLQSRWKIAVCSHRKVQNKVGSPLKSHSWRTVITGLVWSVPGGFYLQDCLYLTLLEPWPVWKAWASIKTIRSNWLASWLPAVVSNSWGQTITETLKIKSWRICPQRLRKFPTYSWEFRKPCSFIWVHRKDLRKPHDLTSVWPWRQRK